MIGDRQLSKGKVLRIIGQKTDKGEKDMSGDKLNFDLANFPDERLAKADHPLANTSPLWRLQKWAIRGRRRPADYSSSGAKKYARLRAVLA
ncbi:MAG TPA: hypothetical protein VNS32_11575 [Flavisolibacter sp.]|nr:hypothetical protein [Flavisolibacter sp.]